MRTVYRNPKELATCLKDLVDNYLEFLISYDELKEKVNIYYPKGKVRRAKYKILILTFNNDKSQRF